jgi:hypothetical protein
MVADADEVVVVVVVVLVVVVVVSVDVDFVVDDVVVGPGQFTASHSLSSKNSNTLLHNMSPSLPPSM